VKNIRPDFTFIVDDDDDCDPEVKVWLTNDDNVFVIEFETHDDDEFKYNSNSEATYKNGVLMCLYGIKWRGDVSREFGRAYHTYAIKKKILGE